jgi:hypothetical protein
MKKAIKQFIYMSSHWDVENYTKKWEPEAWSFKMDESEYRVFVSEQMIEVDIPENWDPVPGQVAALEAEKRTALAEYQQRVEQINKQLSKLQAIEYS